MRELLDPGSAVLAVASRQKYTPLQVLPARAVFSVGISWALQRGDEVRGVVERLKGEAAAGEKALHLPADRFGKLDALRGEDIHLGDEHGGGVFLL